MLLLQTIRMVFGTSANIVDFTWRDYLVLFFFAFWGKKSMPETQRGNGSVHLSNYFTNMYF